MRTRLRAQLEQLHVAMRESYLSVLKLYLHELNGGAPADLSVFGEVQLTAYFTMMDAVRLGFLDR